MPYLNAVTKELLRKHPPTYFVLSHAVTEPSKLAGYDIPLRTTVEFFTPPIGNDPKIWSDQGRCHPGAWGDTCPHRFPFVGPTY